VGHLCSNFVTSLLFETNFSSILINHISVNRICFYCRLRNGKVDCLQPHYAAPCYHNFLVCRPVWDNGERPHLPQNDVHEYDLLMLYCISLYHVRRGPLHFQRSKIVLTIYSMWFKRTTTLTFPLLLCMNYTCINVEFLNIFNRPIKGISNTKSVKHLLPVTIAERSKAWILFVRSDPVIVVRIPIFAWMFCVYICLFCFRAVLCLAAGIEMSWSLI
jgi:hypothetical protein